MLAQSAEAGLDLAAITSSPSAKGFARSATPTTSCSTASSRRREQWPARRAARVRLADGQRVRDALVAGAVASVVSGAPSTIHALVTRRDPLEATLAAGTLLVPRERRRGRLLLAAIPVHTALSVAWAAVLTVLLPRRRTVAAAPIAGLAIAALDLGLGGRRFPRIRTLTSPPQVADHVAYALTVGYVLVRRRSRRAAA